MFDYYKSACPREAPLVKQPESVRDVVRALNGVAFALRNARERMDEGLAHMSEDELTSLLQCVTQDNADDLTSLILAFCEGFGRTIGLFLGVVSWSHFVERAEKFDAMAKELETSIEQKNEEIETVRRRSQALVSGLEAAQVAAQATESSLRERLAHLERALVYASAQVGERR